MQRIAVRSPSREGVCVCLSLLIVLLQLGVPGHSPGPVLRGATPTDVSPTRTNTVAGPALVVLFKSKAHLSNSHQVTLQKTRFITSPRECMALPGSQAEREKQDLGFCLYWG